MLYVNSSLHGDRAIWVKFQTERGDDGGTGGEKCGLGETPSRAPFQDRLGDGETGRLGDWESAINKDNFSNSVLDFDDETIAAVKIWFCAGMS